MQRSNIKVIFLKNSRFGGHLCFTNTSCFHLDFLITIKHSTAECWHPHVFSCFQIQMEGFHKLQDDLEKVIEKDDSSSSITTDSDETKPQFRNFNDKLRYIIHTSKFQIAVVCLVIFDSLLVITELLLDLKVFPAEASESIAPHVLHYTSISILGIFVVEIIVRICVLRLSFFREKLELFDAVVVIVSLVLDVVYHNNEGPESGAGLLIILRLWRVTRILNGL